MEAYEKGEKLGEGQFGVVIKARHKEVSPCLLMADSLCSRSNAAAHRAVSCLADGADRGHQEDPHGPGPGGVLTWPSCMRMHALHAARALVG
jgi:hypothetical protein